MFMIDDSQYIGLIFSFNLCDQI